MTSPRSFCLEVAEQQRERLDGVDIYLPGAGQPRPAIVFVHGGPIPVELQAMPRDWPTYIGYGRYAASQGVVGVTMDHRLHGVEDFPRSAEDLAAAVEVARADPRVDARCVALWFFSGGGMLSATWLAAPPPWLRCVAATYPVLAPLPKWGPVDPRFRPAKAVAAAGRLPIVLTRVGLERTDIAATIAEFLAAAGESDASVEVLDAPCCHHGFETVDHTEQSRHAVRSAVRSVLAHLDGS